MVNSRKRLLLLVVLVALTFVGVPAWAAPAPEKQPAAAAVNPIALRRAIEDLSATFGDRYPSGQAYLARLANLEKTKDANALAELKREALLANPLVGGRPILFVVRRQYNNHHGTEATMCQTGEVNTQFFLPGGAMKTLDPATGKVTTLIELPSGIARDPEVGFDGKRIVFSMRRDIRDDYHLYEINSDGSGLEQLTFGSRISDIQPVYMPDGQIVFSSTREPKYIPCQRHLMANLFTMNADGSNVRQLGHNTQFEGRASLMPDGRILYTRWEYVDKHYASAYGLWTMNPDGTNQALYYGGYAWQPGPVVDARIVPGTHKCVAVFSAVHELAWGAMVVFDPFRGLDGTEPIDRSWPADITPWMRDWNTVDRVGNRFDSFRGVRVKYEDPYPLSDKYFLCSRLSGAAMGIFLVDTFGNELLLHAEGPGCFDPMPIAPRERPPVVPSRIDLAKDYGTFYVQDVYQGEFMDRVERGTVKSIRIVEAPAKLTFPAWNIGDWTPSLNVDGHHPVAVNWSHYNTKRILGRVPVESDGSAYFKVPADRFVYFQLLDEHGLMVHSMRSGTSLQPGEEAGCTGCHQKQQTSPVLSAPKATIALARAPSEIEPWYGPARDFSFTAEVQPVLDRHCVRCHDDGEKAAEPNLSGDLGPAFNVAYTSLLSRSPAVWMAAEPGGKKPLVSAVGAGPIKVIAPYSWGAHRSRLIDLLREGHEDVKLDKESFDRIATWIDLNTPYYPTYATYYGANTFGRCPLSHKQLSRLGQLVAASPGGAKYQWSRVNSYDVGQLSRLIMTVGSPINFTRPEQSLCLSGFADKTDPQYVEALSIIRSGAELLEEHPRADMPHFVPCEADQRRLDYHRERVDIEARTRRAMVAGEKAP